MKKTSICLLFIIISVLIYAEAIDFLKNQRNPLFSDAIIKSNFAIDSLLFIYSELDTCMESNSLNYHLIKENGVRKLQALDKTGEILSVGIPNSYKLSGYMQISNLLLDKKFIILYDNELKRLNFYLREKPYKFHHMLDLEDYDLCYGIYLHEKLIIVKSPEFNKASESSLSILRIKKNIFNKYQLKEFKKIPLPETQDNSKKINACLDETDNFLKFKNIVMDKNIDMLSFFYQICSGGANNNAQVNISKKNSFVMNTFGEHLHILDDDYTLKDSLIIEPIRLLHKQELSRKTIKNSLIYAMFTVCNAVLYNPYDDTILLSYILSDFSKPESGEQFLNLYYDNKSHILLKSEYTNDLAMAYENNKLYILHKDIDKYQIILK